MAKSPAQLDREIAKALAKPRALTPKIFSEILSGVRDGMLADMRRDGFWFKDVLRHDATPWDLNNGYCIEFAENVIALIGVLTEKR